MRTVVVTGVSSPLGQRVLARLEADADVEEIVGLDSRPPGKGSPKLRYHVVDLRNDDLKPLLEEASAIVHLAWNAGRPRDRRRGGTSEAERASVEGTRRLLDAAGGVGTGHLVHLSTAMVYGAWADNPIPIPEEATLRPNPGVGYAAAHAEGERLVADWRSEHPGSRVTVLRPALVVGGGENWLTAALVRGNRATQYLHIDDLAAAVPAVLARPVDGACNVAPDGWVADDAVAGLVGRPRLPEAALRWSWRLWLSDSPPSLAPYRHHPWVVANDRIRATGWQPEHSNEEAVVVTRAAVFWQRLTARRRQELALGASGALVAGAAAATVSRLRRRR